MATVKVKFRPSARAGKAGRVYYQVIHKRVIRQLRTGYRIFADEWDAENGSVRQAGNNRGNYIRVAQIGIAWDVKRLQTIIQQLVDGQPAFTADDVVSVFRSHADEQSVFCFMRSVIVQLQCLGKPRTAETYQAALKSFMQFRAGRDLLLDEVDSEQMLLYEAYLRDKGITKNSTSFYMRILRAVYNRAVEKGLAAQRQPFKYVYTGIDKTVKRAIPLQAVKRLKKLDLSQRPRLEFARDMFLFSFYTRGMSFIDMAYLRKTDLANGILAYRRRKTGQQLFIRWEKCMQDIVDKYAAASCRSPYLLPILNYPDESRSHYKNTLYRVNKYLKEVARLAGLSVPLTLYVARHSWASAARSKQIPVSVISEGMGHDSEKTTQIYLASLDNAVIDRANAQILKDL